MPDVNILIYAHRRDFVEHDGYRAWLESLVNAPQPFALSVLVAVGFVRVVTSLPAQYVRTPLTSALAAVDSLVSRSNCRLVSPGPTHWVRVRALCAGTAATGKRVADAQHAAVALEHGCELVTRDRDFAAFEPLGLRWSHLSLPAEPR